MKFFEGNGKFNWVDENNVVLGYDSQSSCCEWYDWFLDKEPKQEPPEDRQTLLQTLDWENWWFDVSFFETHGDGPRLDCGGIAIFRLRRKNSQESLYLHLFNCHNGYYSHGFQLIDKGRDIQYHGSL